MSNKEEEYNYPDEVPLKHKKVHRNKNKKRNLKFQNDFKKPFSDDSSDAFHKAFKIKKDRKEKVSSKNKDESTERNKKDILVMDVLEINNKDKLKAELDIMNEENSDIVIASQQ